MHENMEVHDNSNTQTGIIDVGGLQKDGGGEKGDAKHTNDPQAEQPRQHPIMTIVETAQHHDSV